MAFSQNVRLTSEKLQNYFNNVYSNVESTRPDVDVSELISEDILGYENDTFYSDMVNTISFLLSYDKSKDLLPQFNEHIECDLFTKDTFDYCVDKIMTFEF